MQPYIALNRFGLGARPGQAASLTAPRVWLDQQLVAPPAPLPHEAGLPDTRTVMTALLAAKQSGSKMQARQAAAERLRADVEAWWASRLHTQAPFFHRWWAFWSNHFTVSAAKRQVVGLWGAFQRDAIRPHVLGRFDDLLLSAVQHPAMLLYLDNARSVGANSRAGTGSRGLNENLAREVLELHTLGVDGGYSQDDIVQMARLLTGWSVANRASDLAQGGFRFRPRAHEPGSKHLLGQDVAQGLSAGQDAIRSLAHHPSTRRHLCRKLARHFVADDPDDALVAHLEQAWERSGGRLSDVGRALIEHDAAWHPEARKLKTPADLVTSAARALSMHDASRLERAARRLGQPIALAPSPAGWDDDIAAWAGPESMLGRVDLAVKLGNQHHRTHRDAAALGHDLLGDGLDSRAVTHLRQADPRRSLTLLFASPAFQRR